MKRHLIVFLLLLAAVGTNAQNRDLPQLSIKTNALGWSMAVTNVAVEIDIAEDWWIPVIFFCLISLALAYYLSEGIRGIVTIIEDVSASIKRRKKSE